MTAQHEIKEDADARKEKDYEHPAESSSCVFTLKKEDEQYENSLKKSEQITKYVPRYFHYGIL